MQLTWDETDHERVTALNRKFNKDELLNMDFNAYLASSSEEGEEEDREGLRLKRRRTETETAKMVRQKLDTVCTVVTKISPEEF